MAPKKRTTRASPATTTTTTTPVTNAQLKALIDQGIADALAARDADRSMNGDDNHNSGTGVRRQAPLARECTYTDFIKYKPLYFKGTEGVVELTQWFERMETVFRISNYTVENQINPRDEIKKLEVEMWNLKVKGTDVVGYNQCFQELALMCAMMFPEESDKIEKYVGSLPDMIHGTLLLNVKLRIRGNSITTTKKQGVAIAYTARSGERKEYAGTLPLCNKCKFHHNGQCTVKCANCKRVGHLTQDCTRAREMVHALGGGETNQDLNDMEHDINA
ncbi:hypothetical protein Tco_0880293 [Tanacetum coccineum]